MDKSKVVVFLDPGHCKSTPGKTSPDKTLREYAYAREILKGITAELDKLGIEHWTTHPEEDFVYKTKGTCKDLDSRDLVLRTTRINDKYAEVKKQGKKAFLISIHVNAAGSGKWNTASGFSIYISTNASENSKKLAKTLYAEAEANKLKGNRSVPKEKYWTANFWILRKSNCPAVLTENLFQDNKEEVKWLLSDEGKKTIIKLHVTGIENYIKSL